MKQTKPDFKSVVAKDNELIEQMAKFELSELRLIAYCLAHYDSRKAENRLFRARVDDLTSLFPIDKKSAYAVIRKTMIGLGKKPLEIRENSKRYYWNWFSGFCYDEGTGEFEFKITPEIQPYLLKLEGSFTRYRLGDVYQFKAASTWKLYELLKRWLKAGSWETELDELRLLLGVAGKYPRWSSLDQWILKPTTAEINKTSDIRVSYNKLKRGRRIVGLIFEIRPNRPEDANAIKVNTTQEELYLALRNAGLHQKTARKYANDADRGGKTFWIQKNLPGWIKKSQTKKNPKSYLQGVLKQEIGQGVLFDNPPQKSREQQKSELSAMAKKIAKRKKI